MRQTRAVLAWHTPAARAARARELRAQSARYASAARGLRANAAGDEAQRRSAATLAAVYSSLALRSAAVAAEVEASLPTPYRVAAQAGAQRIARATALTLTQAMEVVHVHGPDVAPAEAQALHEEIA